MLEENDEIFPGAEVLVEQPVVGAYRRAAVVAAGGEEVTVLFSDGHQEHCARSAVWPANEVGLFVDDLTQLTHLSSATILENMRNGLHTGRIYMWIGPVLLAVNPMRPLPQLYNEAAMAKCSETRSTRDLPAHPFAQAEAALRELERSARSASFVVSGESGAGKTETSRQLLAYALWRSEGAKGFSAARLAEMLPEVSSVVELFGSAATLHNANSSRVGRFLTIDYSGAGSGRGRAAVCGARLQTFLLERSRVIAVGSGERSFHVFYGLLASKLAAEIALHAHGKGAASFGYLRPGKSTLNARDDAADFNQVLQALASIGLLAEAQRSVGQLLAAVLLLGNAAFQQDEDGVASAVPATRELTLPRLASWLGCDVSAALTKRQLSPGGLLGFGEPVVQNLDANGAVRARDALARALYARLFHHLLEQINAALAADAHHHHHHLQQQQHAPPSSPPKAHTPSHAANGHGKGGASGGGGSASISLLDIFGFERFDVNSLEQLLINFANEKLHAHFLTSFFDAEQAAYSSEGVAWPDVVQVPSNAELISLVECAPYGLLPLLDDQCTLPSPDDAAFCTAAVQAHTRSALFSRPKVRRAKRGKRGADGDAAGAAGSQPKASAPSEFVVRHFAGAIKYSTVGFVEKNTDRLPPDALAALSKSTDALIRTLFSSASAADADRTAAASPFARKKGAPATTSSVFSADLRGMLERLRATSTHFVRCVRPRGGVHALDDHAEQLEQIGFDSSLPPGVGGGGAPTQPPPPPPQQPMLMHGGVVLPQLEASGVLEAVSLMALGFPTRVPYEELHKRTAGALPEWASQLPPRELARAIVTAAELREERGDVAYGQQSLFCRAGKAAFLERLLAADGALESAEVVATLVAILEDHERRKAAMPIVQKNLHMWVHRRRFLALRQEKRDDARKAARARLRSVGWQVARSAGVARLVAEKRAEAEEARRKQRAEQEAVDARRKKATGAFRAAARSSLTFAGAQLRIATAKVDGSFGGVVVHAGHLRLDCDVPLTFPRGECYCVLLSSRTLLCFEPGTGSFDPLTGDATEAMPVMLDDGAEPSLYNEADRVLLAQAVHTWVRRLSAVLVPEALRGSRFSLARTTTVSALQSMEDDDEDEDDDEKKPKQPAKPRPYLAGEWLDGCYYRGDGSIAYYDSKCTDDPYAIG